jgi:signal transduction histidine kinase
MKAIAKDRPTGQSRIRVDILVAELEPLLQSQVKSTTNGAVALKFNHAQPVRGYSYAVMADSVKLERVVLNLVDNAGIWASQTPRGHGRVVLTVSPASVEEQGSTGVMIAVEDNGPGIDPDVRPQIFSRFFTTRKGAGTGLGLYLVQRFVSEMGGHVDVQSQPGRTVFSVILPSLEAQQ